MAEMWIANRLAGANSMSGKFQIEQCNSRPFGMTAAKKFYINLSEVQQHRKNVKFARRKTAKHIELKRNAETTYSDVEI